MKKQMMTSATLLGGLYSPHIEHSGSGEIVAASKIGSGAGMASWTQGGDIAQT